MEGSETSRDNRAVEKKSNREGKKEEREASISPAVQEAIPNPEMEGWAEDDVEERGEGDSSVLFHFMNRNLDQTKPKRKKKKKK